MVQRIKWAPKIQPALLVKFYKMSELGIIDEELIDDVGSRLYLRCESIVMIAKKLFYCPDCDEIVTVNETNRENDESSCHNCNFVYTVGEFKESWRHRELWQGNAGEYFEKYYNEYQKCRTPNEKVIMIDTLIHSFHIDAKTKGINRVAGNNLIEGSLKQVVILLDKLSGIQPENDIEFAKNIEKMWKRRRGNEK